MKYHIIIVTNKQETSIDIKILRKSLWWRSVLKSKCYRLMPEKSVRAAEPCIICVCMRRTEAEQNTTIVCYWKAFLQHLASAHKVTCRDYHSPVWTAHQTVNSFGISHNNAYHKRSFQIVSSLAERHLAPGRVRFRITYDEIIKHSQITLICKQGLNEGLV